MLHRQHTRGAVVSNRHGHNQAIEIGKLRAQRDEIACLLAIIQFAQDAFAKLLEHLLKLVALPKLGVVIEEGRDFIERFEIFHHGFANPGPLHFYGDALTTAQDRAMHLA
jgi:hypothetical protein